MAGMTTHAHIHTIQVFGIAHCDTVKKARQWLTTQQLDFVWHDFKKAPPTAEHIAAWQQAVGWDKLLNRQGQTWRKLSPEQQAQIRDAPSAAAFLLQQPSAIKRPVVQWPDGRTTIGFKAGVWAEVWAEVVSTGALNNG